MVEFIFFFIHAGGPIPKTHPLVDAIFKEFTEHFGLFWTLLLDSQFIIWRFLLEADGVSCNFKFYVNADTFKKRKANEGT